MNINFEYAPDSTGESVSSNRLQILPPTDVETYRRQMVPINVQIIPKKASLELQNVYIYIARLLLEEYAESKATDQENITIITVKRPDYQR